jgi:hypothetical protein
MPGLPVGRCRYCDAPVSYFARICPYCHAANLPNPVAIVAALVAVLVVGGVVALGVYFLRGKGAQAPAQADNPPGASSPTAEAKDDYGWIVQAMADCEEEAKQKLDTLHFLIVPITPTGLSLPGWDPTPISGVGNIGSLLNSTDALIGLRNRVYVLYQKPVTFAVLDPATKTTYKWKPAVGVTALKTRQNALENLTLGFEIPDAAKELEWGPTIALRSGTCYWINPLIRAGARKE